MLGNVQPLDILALQETTSNASLNSPTGQASGKGLIDTLNGFYGAGTYAVGPYQATESGGDVADGNGPNTVIYNTKTMTLLASVPVDPSGGISKLGSSSGEYREVMRYQFQPKNDTNPADAFYVYVSHYKSGTTTSDQTSRAGEAQIIVNNEATLPAGSSVILVGDYNVSSSSEASYQDVVASNSLTNLPTGKGIDPLNLTGATGITWGSSTLGQLTESANDLRYRDDFQVMSQHVYRADNGGLEYINGSYHVFGNNGTTSYQGSVNNRGNTSLSSLVLRGDLNSDGNVTSSDISQMLTMLTDVNGYQSAHSLSNSALLAMADVNRDGVINNADLQALLIELQNPTAANSASDREYGIGRLNYRQRPFACCGGLLDYFRGRFRVFRAGTIVAGPRGYRQLACLLAAREFLHGARLALQNVCSSLAIVCPTVSPTTLDISVRRSCACHNNTSSRILSGARRNRGSGKLTAQARDRRRTSFQANAGIVKPNSSHDAGSGTADVVAWPVVK